MINVKPVTNGKTTRQSFARIDEVLDMPNLIEIQKKSYQWFLDEGLRAVFKDVSPITDRQEDFVLNFLDYKMDEKPKYSIAECKERDATYAKPMRVKVTLENKKTGDIKEQEIYMGDFPIMTDAGTFIINGAERVIVSQLVRSPGVYFDGHYDNAGKMLYDSTIIPNRGAWLEYDTDSSDTMSVRIDKNRKVPITTFIRALLRISDTATADEINADVEATMTDKFGTDDDIREVFGEVPYLEKTIEFKDHAPSGITEGNDALLELYRKLRPGEPPTIESAVKHLTQLLFDPRRYDLSRVGRYKYNRKLSLAPRLAGRMISRPIADPLTGELLAEAGETIDREKARMIESKGVDHVWVYPNAEDTSVEFKIFSNGMVDIHDFVDYDLTAEGINEKVRFDVLCEILEKNLSEKDFRKECDARHDELIPPNIRKNDILASINYMCGLYYGIGNTDDIDHLGNRRIRCVGELLQNQFRIGFARMERVVHERMATQAQDAESVTAQTLINIRPVVAAMKEFFGSSPLSQFMDQTNPLAELTHKRRLSALGPGGLSRERAGFEVRDVHYSHYGRMCPIETPEGPNIGLISYLASFARINQYGFVEAPYRKVVNGVVTDEVTYMTADVEDEYVVAQANEPLDENGHFIRENVSIRYRDTVAELPWQRVDYMDVSPKMVVSVATAMIPFLENDDANRALMGANMQRQAVPLMKTEAPIVGTGMEYKAAHDSGIVVLSDVDGIVEYVDATHIDVRTLGGELKRYEIIKFLRSNQGTCFNQRPIVAKGDHVVPGQVIADGPATSEGEISLGKNMLIGFMTWEGYNYEDAVLINEKLVRDDLFTSIHIEEYETESRETKLGPEEITKDIPNVGDDLLSMLDDSGIIRIGSEVRSGDYLVGKVTPKGEQEMNAEEKLLRAIFGEKVKEVRDTSLKLPHGAYGTVVDVKIFTQENSDELAPGVNKIVRVYIAQKRKISVGDKMAGRHGNKGVVSRVLPSEDMPFLPDGTPLDIVLNPLGVPSRMNIGQVLEVHLGRAAAKLGWKVATPVFDGAHEEDIREMFREAGLPEDGKIELRDGRTGEPFDHPVTVGYMYYLKLHHLVDDKIHARSIGPYSLVTQQPLGGKAQFGGQRFGEMEVWALEAYGAAYTLQEILTVKSDDVVGRVKTFESIVKGLNIPTPGIPEAFRVLIKELQSLALDVRVLNDNGEEIDLKQEFDDDDYSNRNRKNFDDAYEEETVEVEKEIEQNFGFYDENGEADESEYQNEEQDYDGSFEEDDE